MTIKLGGTTINKVMLGSTEIRKAYLGSTVIHDVTGGGGGGITGHDAPQLVINDTTTTTAYSGTLTGVQAGERIYMMIGVLGNNAGVGGNVSGWTVTLGGSANITPTDSIDIGASVDSTCGIYEIDAPGTGDLTLSVSTVGDCRALAAVAWRIAGHNTSTPTQTADVARNGGNVTSFSHPSGITTANPGAVMLSAIFIDGGDVSGLAVTGADGSAVGETGGNGFNDIEFGYAYSAHASTGSVTHAWSWTTADNCTAGYFEVNPA